MVPLWFFGVCVTIFGTVLTALGLVLQKFSHKRNAKCEEAVVYYRQSWWQVGFAIFVAGQIFNVVAMAMAPQAMLSCLGACSLIFNAVFAWAILVEQIHILELLAMSGMIIGCVCVIVTTPRHGISDLTSGTAGMQEIAGPFFTASFLWLSAGIVSLLVLFRFTVALHFIECEPVFWALCSAVASGYTVMLFKCISLLLVAWGHTRPYAHWETFAVLIVGLALCLFQVHTLNIALHHGRAMTVVPTIFAFSLLSQIGLCQAAYQEINGIEQSEAAFFIFGICLMLVSVVGLVRVKIAAEVPSDPEGEELAKSLPIPAAVPLIKAGSQSMPARTYSVGGSLDANGMGGGEIGFMRSYSMSSLDHEAFQESFCGRQRSYTVSVCGPLGVA